MEELYYEVEISEPANAKSQSWVLHLEGKPEKHFVRYSTQFGPPAEVPNCNISACELFGEV